ncbi:MAG: 4-hydroxybutyryl-CoA dehydratase, partial [Syntrophales bacterium]|nr:4-hydroxybutyryl-CoA dehydratase [Syntrophales bacterium]
MIMSGQDYRNSLQGMGIVTYIDGERSADFWDHPAVRPAVNALAATYDLAYRPDLEPEIHRLITLESPLTGGQINRFLHIIQSPEDLLNRMRLQRAIMRYTGGCFGGRCVAGAVINALWSVTFEVDEKTGGRTTYH